MSALPTDVAAPADNPSTPETIARGRLLFWDPILSGPKDVACATCHHPDLGYADDRDLPIGVNGAGLGAARSFVAGTPAHVVKRNSQTLLNRCLTARSPASAWTAPMHRLTRRCSGIRACGVLQRRRWTTLRDVINFYDRARGGGRGGGGCGGGARGGTQHPNGTRDQLDPLLRQLNVRGRRQNDLMAFLGALNDPTCDKTVPCNRSRCGDCHDGG